MEMWIESFLIIIPALIYWKLQSEEKIETKELTDCIPLLFIFIIMARNGILTGTIVWALVNIIIWLTKKIKRKQKRKLIARYKSQYKELTKEDFDLAGEENYNLSNLYLAIAELRRKENKYKLFLTIIATETEIIFTPAVKEIATGKYTFTTGKTKLIDYNESKIFLIKEFGFEYFGRKPIGYKEAKEIFKKQTKGV